MKSVKMFITAAVLAAMFSGCKETGKSEGGFAKYATVKIGTENTAYIDAISIYGQEVLNLYRFAAMEADNIFWMQACPDRAALDTISDARVKAYAAINYGPWDRIGGKSFVEGYEDMPAGLMFYPEDMTAEEWAAFDDPDKMSPYTLIRRDSTGSLTTVWYHDAYSENIGRICDYLKAAADLTIVPSVREYLLAKIEGLRTDSYEQSAVKWLEMDDSKMDLVLGPNESSDDKLHGIKRSYSAYVVLKNLAETERMAKFSAMLPQMQASLPCEDRYKEGFVPGDASTIYVCDALYYAGAANCGIKDIAISLPFDTKVQEEKGTRCLLMQNVISYKFNGILTPTADLVISDTDRAHVTDKAFFWNVAFREIAHGLGVKTTVDGKDVEEALDNLASVIEEVKALAVGVYLSSNAISHFETDHLITDRDSYATFLTAILRSARFGNGESVGRANIICYNFLKEAGAFKRHKDGCYYIDYEAFGKGISDLCAKVLAIQGEGGYNAAEEFVQTYGNIDRELNADCFSMMLEGIPVDVKFEFVW